MAMLAVLDVDDVATPKIQAVKNALDDLAKGSVAASRTAASATRGIADTGGLQEQLSALQALNRQWSTIKQQAGAYSLLQQQMKVGTTVTKEQAGALQSLTNATLDSDRATDKMRFRMMALTGGLKEGTVVTDDHRKKLAEAAKEFGKVNGLIDQTNSQVNTATSRFREFSAAAAALAVVFALVAGSLYSMLRGSVDLSARIETLGVVIGVVAKNVHLSSTEMFVQVDAIKKLGITTRQAEDAVLQFAQASLKMADASKLARAAQDLAVVAGMDSSQAFTILVNAIDSMNTRMLRQFGILVSQTKLFDDYAKTLKKTANELTDTERKQAILNKIFDEGRKFAGAYESAMGTAGKQMGSLARYVEEAKVALGDALLPTMSLVVRALTSMLKTWIELPKPIQASVTAILAATAAMAMFSAALAGAKFLGITEAVLKLGVAFKLLWVGMTGPGAMSLGAAALAAFGAWPLAIMGIVVALGLAVGAWVKFSSQTRISVEQLQQQVAAAVSAQESTEKLGKEAEALTAKFSALRAKGVEPTRADLDRYREIAEKLLAIAPQTVRVIDAEGRQYEILADQIQQVVEAKGRLAQETLGEMKTEADRTAAAKVAAEARLRLAQQELGRIERGEARATTTVTLEYGGRQTIDRAAALRAEITRLLAQTKELAGAAQRAGDAYLDAYKRAAPPAERLRFALEESNKVQVEYFAKLTGGDATKGLEEYQRRIRALGVEGTKLAQAVQKSADPEKMKESLASLDVAWEKHEAKVKKAAEQYKKAFDDMVKKLRGEGATPAAALAAIAQELDKSKLPLDEYNRRIAAVSGELLRFGKATPDYIKGLGLTEEQVKRLNLALADLETRRLTEWARTIRTSLHEAMTAIEQATGEASRRWGEELKTAETEASYKREDARRSANDRIEEMDRDLAERLIVSKMSEVDRAIYEERRRVVEIAKQVEREIEARERALQAEERVIKRRSEAMQQELREIIWLATVKQELREAELQAQLAIAEREQDVAAVRDLQAKIQLHREMMEQFKQNAEGLRQLRTQEIRDREQDALRLVTIERGANEKIAQDQRAAVQRQIEGSQILQQRIRRDYSEIQRVVQTTWTSVVEIASKGVSRILTGQESIKEGLVGIWESIKQRLFSIFDSIVDGWIKRATQMATGEGGFDVSKFFGGLFGGTGGAQQTSTFTVPPSMRGRMEAMGYLPSTSIGGGWTGLAPGQTPQATQGGFWGSTGGRGLQAGAVGGMVGYQVGSTTTSPKWGAASGAATGFAYGMASGNPVIGAIGAGIGALAGWIGGKVGQSKEYGQVKDLRAELEESYGGWQKLAQKAAEVGYDVKNLWVTKSMKDYEAELKKLNDLLALKELKAARENLIAVHGGLSELIAAAEEGGHTMSLAFMVGSQDAAAFKEELEAINKALELKEAKDALSRTFSQLVTLRKQAQLVGFDIQKLYDAKTIEEFNAQQTRLNKLLEAQQARIGGLTTAASGLETRVAGLTATLERRVGEFFEGIGGDLREEFERAFEVATEEGYTGSQFEFARENADKFDLSLEDIAKVSEDVQDEINRIGVYATAVFGGMLRETGDLIGALALVMPSLDQLAALMEVTGTKAEGAFAHLMSLREAIRSNEDVAQSLSGITQILTGLADAGRLTADVFNLLGSDAVSQWEALSARQVDSNTAMLMMQPTLQALYEAQKQFGFATDEATQKLIDMAVEQGYVGDQFQDVNSKILDVLLIIAKVLGADIPSALDTMRREGVDDLEKIGVQLGDVEQAAIDVGGELTDSAGIWNDWRDTAVSAAKDVEDAVTAVALGSSPGGLKEIRVQAMDAAAAMRALRQSAVEDAGQMEQAVDRVSVGESPAPSRSEGSEHPYEGETVVVNFVMDGERQAQKILRRVRGVLRPVGA